MREFYGGVAPKELILQDLKILASYDHLDTSEKIQELLFMQSVEGRSHNGAGVFTKRTYVNTTIDDIVQAVGYDPEGVKKQRQRLIDDIIQFVNDTFSSQKRDRLMNNQGEPFLGIPFFRDRKVNARDILRGLYIGGLRDNATIRKETEAIYKVKIGCGECYLVDIHKMESMNLDGEILAHEAHEDKIEQYIKDGLIMPPNQEIAKDETRVFRYYYVRHRIGPGQSDDAAVVVTGILYNVDVALGVFLSDAIDTLEKYAPQCKDQDQELSYYIARGFRDLKITMEDVYEITYLSSIPEAEEELIPDSSLRYLISIDTRSTRTAIQNHIAYIEGKPVSEISISFKRIMSTQFYEYIKRRLVNARRIDRLTVPELSIEQLKRQAGDLAHQNFIVVSKDKNLKDVVQKFKDSKSELVIVVDKKKNIIGTLSATDLINLSR